MFNAVHSTAPVHEKSLEALEETVTQLKVAVRFLKEGLNVPDEPAAVREDVQNEAE